MIRVRHTAFVNPGSRLAYPKWMLPLATEICTAYREGFTPERIAKKYRTRPTYVRAFLKDMGAYRPKMIGEIRVPPPPEPPPLIKHPSERFNWDYAEEEQVEPPKMRKCLGGCGQHFLSTGPGNRICDPCGERSAYAFNGEYTMGVG